MTNKPFSFIAVKHIASLLSAIVITAMAISATTPSYANPAADFLKKIEGSWRGKGTAKQSEDGAKEAILCKISSTFDEKSAKLSTTGKCAAVQGKISIRGNLRYHAPTDRYMGSLFSKMGQDGGSTSSGGRLIGKSLVLQTVRSNSNSKIVSKSRITITPKGRDSYIVETSATNMATGKTYNAGTLTFKKQK